MAISTSSLLNSAAARRNKIQEQEDSLVAFEYSLSAKTYGDFAAYNAYLQDRATKNSSDPSKVLTYQKAIVGARKGYVSNEIQRANIDIIEGRADNNGKYERMKDLFYQALDNGDYDLAQSLNLQLDNLSVKIQQEEIAKAEAQQRAYGNAASAGAKSLDDLTKKLQNGVDYIQLADGTVVKPLAMLARELNKAGGTDIGGKAGNIWEEANKTMAAIRGVIIDSWDAASSQDDLDKLEQKYGAGLQDIDEKLVFKIAGKDLTAQKIQVAAENEAINNPIYNLKAIRNEATGQNEFELVENQVERAAYTRQYDPETGEEFYAPTTVRTDQEKLMFGQSDQGRGLDTQLTDSGEVIGGDKNDKSGKISLSSSEVVRDDSQTIGNRLKQFGIIAKQNGTTLTVKLNGESVEREATIQPDGSIRYFKDNGELAEIGLVNRNLGTDALPQQFQAGQERIVAPDEISDFGEASAFGGQLSKASAQGREYMRNFTQSAVNDVAPVDLRTAKLSGMAAPVLNGNIRTGNDFSGRGSPVVSNLLQGASFTQGNILKEKQAAIALQAQQEAAQRLQQAQAFNLNQTPVSQFASNGVLRSQLRVAPIPTQRISRVGVATPGRISNVSVAPAQPRVTVAAPTRYARNVSVGGF